MEPLHMEDPLARGQRRGRCEGPNFCVRVATWVTLSCFVGLMLSVSIAWHVMKPDEPVFHVGSIAISNFTVSNSELKGEFDVGLTIKNPNKKVKVQLDHFKVRVFHGKVSLAEGSAETMYLEKMSETHVVSSFSAKLAVDVNMSEDLSKEVVNLNVMVHVRVKYEYGIWPSSERLLDGYCSDLDVFFAAKSGHTTGNLLGAGKNCRVQIGFSHSPSP